MAYTVREQLKNQVNASNSELEKTKKDLAEMTQACNTYNLEMKELLANFDELVEIAESNKFLFYYVKPGQSYGVSTLDSILQQREWAIDYEEGVFDCSEMSAYMERYLENEGFRTIIVAGDSPSGTGSRHAWLLVETSKGKYMPVEATGAGQAYLVKWSNRYFDEYYEYDHEFETIQEALDYSPSEFDWWKG